MVKKNICYGKNCWSTKFSVLREAVSKEEEHFNENLMRRATPHTHKEENKEDDFSEEVINKAITEVKTEVNNEVNNYQENNLVSFYGLEDNQDKKIDLNKNLFAIKKNTANMGHDHDSPVVNEFLYEKIPTGGIRQTPLYLSIKGQLLKKGILLKFLENKFDTYR